VYKFALLILLIFTSCYKNHLYVQQELIDRTFLASSYVGTFDPKQDDPPFGQRIIISWDFPRSLYKKDLTMMLTVRFKNNCQELHSYKIQRKRGYTAFFFEEEIKDKKSRILTYKIDVLNKDNVVVETWKHQFWRELISFSEDN
jgi:hypothetical protein